MSDRRRRSPSDDRDRDRANQRHNSRDRDGPARDPFGRDESRRGKYNSPYPDSSTAGSSGGPSYRHHDDRRRRRSPSSSPSPPPRAGGGRGGRGDSFRRRPNRATTRNFNFSEEDWTQPGQSDASTGRRRNSRAVAEQASTSWGTGENSEALEKFEKLRSYTPYLLKRRKQIIREGKERQFAEQLDDIKFWLDSARDIKSDQTLGVNGLKNCLTGIMEMARNYPIKEAAKDKQQVFDVSSSGDEDEDEPEEEYEPHYSHARTKSESPRPQPKLEPTLTQRLQRSSAFPKADITTNWDYDPSKPDVDEEDEPPPIRVPPSRQPVQRPESQSQSWNNARRREENDEAFFRRGHVGGGAGRQREYEQERVSARNPSPPPQKPTRSTPVTPNQRQSGQPRRSAPPPVYNPFDQLSDEDEDNGGNDNDDDIFAPAAGPSSPTPTPPKREDDDFESMYQRPVRRPPPPEPLLQEPEPEFQHQHSGPSSASSSTYSDGGFAFAPREHGIPQRHGYHPENSRRVLHPENLPGPEIPLESPPSANVYDPRAARQPHAQPHAPMINGHTHAHAGMEAGLLGQPPSGAGMLGVAPDPRLARQGQSQTVPQQVDPRLGPQRAPTYATPMTGAPMPMQHQQQQQPMPMPMQAAQQQAQQPLIDPVAAMAAQVTQCLGVGVGLTPQQQQLLAVNLTMLSGAAGVGVAPQTHTQLPFAAQQPGGFHGQRPPSVGFPVPAQFMQPPPIRNPYPGAIAPAAQLPRQPAPSQAGAGAPNAGSNPVAPEIDQELLNAQFRAKAAMCFSRSQSQNRMGTPNSNSGPSNRSNFVNPKRFTGPSRHGAPNRFPFKQDLPPRRPPAAEEARRREREAEERELVRELAERERTKAPESSSSKESTTEKQVPLIATNQIPATVRPGMKNRVSVSGSQKSSSSSGGGSSSSKSKELERTRERVKDRLADLLPQAQKKTKMEEIREEVLKTLPGRAVPQSVGARKGSKPKSASIDQRSPETHDSDPDPRSPLAARKSSSKSDAKTAKARSKVQKDGVKRRRVMISSSSSSEAESDGGLGDGDAVSQQIANPSPVPVPRPVPPPSRRTEDVAVPKDLSLKDAATTNPEPSLPETGTRKTTPPPSTTAPAPTAPTITSPFGKKSGSRELADLHGYLREMNFEAHMPTGPRRRGRADEGQPGEASGSSGNSSFSTLADTINAVASGGRAGSGPQMARKKTKPKEKGVAVAGKAPLTKTTGAGRGRGRGRPRKTPPGATVPATGPKRKVGRPSRQVLDALAAAEAASALLSSEQGAEIEDVGISSFDVDAGGKPGGFGGIVIGPNDLLVNAALGKIKMESDYVPPPSVKTEPQEKTAPASIPAAYPQFNFTQDDDDDDRSTLPPDIKLEPEDVDVDPDLFGAVF